MISRMLIDGDGILTLKGTNAELLYHNVDSLKEMGAFMISNSLYPSPEGGDIYHDLKTWGAAQDMTRIKGQMLPIMAKAVYDAVEMVFEMEDRQPKEEHGIFGAIYDVGKLYFDVHNLCVYQKDKLREEVIALGQRHARTFEEIVRLKQDYKWTLTAVEKGFGMKPTTEESPAIITFLRVQQATEIVTKFPNEAIRSVTNDMMLGFAKKGDADPYCLTVEDTLNPKSREKSEK
jgi:hypothetical protein